MTTTTRASFLLALTLLAFCASPSFARASPRLSDERVVFQTTKGDVELGFFPDVAPKTVEHILDLARRGLYTTNHFFRVDAGFVAQVAGVESRSAPMDAYQKEIARRTLPGEFSEVKHARGILSMGRYEDPNSATSSFSILLGDAPHLDHEYAVFGKVTSGEETLRAMEAVETKKEGIFVMPTERIEILSSYVKEGGGGGGDARGNGGALGDGGDCEAELKETKQRVVGLVHEIEEIRRRKLPGR
jgi:cyclophilin family peptidyl-prolyl cis-trans isomerase